MSESPFVAPDTSLFADALFKIKGGLPHAILHRGVLEILSGENGQQYAVAGRSVLEAGCGPGGFTRKLLKLEPESIVAGDVNLQLIERAKNKVSDERLRFIELDLSRPFPLENDSFTCVICISVLMHLPPGGAARAIAEFARVCQADGVVVVAVINTDWAEALYAPATGEGAYARLVPAGDSTIREFYPPPSWYLEAFEKAGMSVERKELCVPSEGAQAGPPYDSRIGEPVWTVYLGSFQTTGNSQ